MKKLFTLLLATAMTASVFGKGTKIGDLYYVLYEESQSAEVCYETTTDANYAALTEIAVPRSVTYSDKTYKVTGVEQGAFKNAANVTKATVADGVKVIGANAFENCANLKTFAIGKDIITIKGDVFKGCTSLASIVWNAVNCNNFNYGNPFRGSGFDVRAQITSFKFGDAVEHLPNSLCAGMTGLTAITLQDSLKEINQTIFSGCTGLTRVNVQSVNCENTNGGMVFYNCPNIATVTFTSDVRTIPESLCEGLMKLKSVTIPTGVTTIGKSAFYTSGLTSVKIGASVTTIESSAFASTGLDTLALPASLTSIGNYAFKNVMNLQSVTCRAVTPPTMGAGVFENVNCSSVSLYVPCEGAATYKKASQWKEFQPIKPYDGYEIKFVNWDDSELQTSYVLEGVTPVYSGETPERPMDDIFVYGFKGWTPEIAAATEDATYKANIEAIGLRYHEGGLYFKVNDDFTITIIAQYDDERNYAGMTNIVVPDSIFSSLHKRTYTVTGIDDGAFAHCYDLESITIGKNVTTIGSAFRGCNSLQNIFWRATNCQDFAFGASPWFVDESYDLTDQITSFVFSDSVKHIPAYLCLNMYQLPSLALPAELESIGEYALALTNVSSLVVPDNVKSIGNLAFAQCMNLESVTIGENVDSIGEAVFLGCSSLNTVVWKAKNCADFSVNSMPFYRGDKLDPDRQDPIDYDIRAQITSFTFGNKVEHIPGYLCCRMNFPNGLTLPASLKTIGKYAFTFSELPKLTIPSGVTAIYEGAFWGSTLASVKLPNSLTSIADWAFFMTPLSSLVLPENVETIGQSAFNVCESLTEVTVYADRLISIQSNTFISSDQIEPINVYVSKEWLTAYQGDENWSKQNVQALHAESTSDIDEAVSVIASTSSVDIAWQMVSNAETYTISLREKSTGNEVCTLTFDKDGFLMAIRYNKAPSRAPQAKQEVGFVYTITDLDANKEYEYTLTAKDGEAAVLDTQSGSFTTQTVPTAIDEADGSNVQSTKLLRDGQILIRRGEKTYTITGQEIR